jgi:hypothetical protein
MQNPIRHLSINALSINPPKTQPNPNRPLNRPADCLYECDLPPDGVEYRHLHCVAKELPSRECVLRVAAVVDDFIGRRPGEYIGIHCAYVSSGF